MRLKPLIAGISGMVILIVGSTFAGVPVAAVRQFQASQPGDVNRDGVVDVRDVTALGVILESQAAVPTPTPIASVAPATLTPLPPTSTPQPSTATAVPTLTSVPATLTPVPTATTMPGMETFGICGESNNKWHPPVITAAFKAAHPEMPNLIVNCETKHEHGDEPKDWVNAFELSRGHAFSFMGPHMTSPLENVANQKHVAMKGYYTVFTVPQGNVEVYAVLHGASVPFERASTKHSARFWFRFNNKVSHIQFQGDFGNAMDNQRRFLRGRGIADPDIRGLMLVADQQSINAGAGCEQWYMEPGNPPFAVDYGITFCDIVTRYQRGEESGNVYDQSRWQITGGSGFNRRLEVAYYAERFNKRGTFWTTNTGDMVSGPNDPRCSDAGVTCLEQVIQSDLPSVNFNTTGGKNAFQKQYDDTGVVAPN